MKELDYTKMGMRIRQVRKAKGWSQDALAKKCGISMSFLGHIERGTRIMSLETFVGLCSALDTDAGELLWGEVKYCQKAVSDMWKPVAGSKSGTDEEKTGISGMNEYKSDTSVIDVSLANMDGTDVSGVNGMESEKEADRNEGQENGRDTYAMYIKIMKSVAEIMNET